MVPVVRCGGAGSIRAAHSLAAHPALVGRVDVSQPKPKVVTRFVVDLNDMDDSAATEVAHALQLMIENRTDHQVARLLYQRNVPWNPKELSGR